jgi:pyridinium-3,5-bisthiocarboxylic acid mononucleotide nickel chelatase
VARILRAGGGLSMGHDVHDHDHEHPQAHAHAGAHPHSPAQRASLLRDAGRGNLLYFDAPSGIAGDMIIAALVDLGVPETVVAEAVAAVHITGFHVHFGTRVRSGIVATSFDVHVDDAQPPRTYASVRQLLDASHLDEGVKKRAHDTFRRLAEAEARVHRTSLDDVHFHEVGAVDAVVDIVGSAAALQWLGADVLVSPLPMGRGYTRSQHGKLPLPAPAVVECLTSFETYDAQIDFELVTPTGAAVVASHARGSSGWPRMTPLRVGWGAGTADLADRPNLLRAVLGEPRDVRSEDAASHVVIEANVDDATGELMGAAIEAVLAAGALDVWTAPVTMKKGRPAWVLGAIAALDRADDVAHAVLRETTTIGVRRYPVSRIERPRMLVTVDTPFGPIPVKVATGPFGPPQVKPEFDACLAAARARGVPVRDVLQAALTAALAKIAAPTSPHAS